MSVVLIRRQVDEERVASCARRVPGGLGRVEGVDALEAASKPKERNGPGKSDGRRYGSLKMKYQESDLKERKKEE